MSALIAAILAACVAADGPAPAAKKPGKPPRHPAVAALKQQVPKAQFDKMPLEDFAEWLERTSKVNVIVRWGYLEKAGVTPDTPVTLKLDGARLSDVLTAVLKAVEKPEQPLGYQATENVITISTRRDFTTKLLTVTYEVQDLLIIVPKFEGDQLSNENLGGTRRAGGTGGGQLLKTPKKGDLDPTLQSADQKIQELVRAITKTIEPDSWKVNGGPGTITYFKGKLIIRNSAEVHRLLRGEK